MNFKKMAKRFFTLSQNHDGFTLVELIVVIAIMAILAGVAVPAYTGYINKANKASDLQLLGAINTAFAAAAMENNENVKALSDTPEPVWNGSKVVSTTMFGAEFEKYYGANADSEFKVIEVLYFNTQDGVFAELPDKYAGLIGGFSATDIENFNKGAFADIGFNALLGQVDMATQVALAADPNSTLGQMVFNDTNMDALAAYLGYDRTNPEEEEKFNEAFQALATEKVNQMIANGADASTDDAMDALYGQASQEILANTAVLNAATNTTNFDTADFKAQLAAGNGKNTIQSSMNSADGNSVALAQTAMAYAMYTSYVERNGGTPSSDYMEVLDVLATDGFKNYMSNADGGDDEATTDMNSYLAAMNMVKDTSGNTDAVSSLLVNGFNDAALSALLNQEISANKTTN